MPKEKQDITIRQGENLAIDIAIGDEEDPTYDADNNLPRRDITNENVRWALAKVKSSGRSRTPVFDKESDAGPTEVEKTDAVNGEARIKLVTADTIGLKVGEYWHQTILVDIAGEEKPVAEGSFTIKPRISEDAD